MIKRKLKPYVLPTFLLIISIIGLSTYAIINNLNSNLNDNPENLTYVSEEIITDDTPVMNTEVKMINPYTEESVTIGKYYYDYKGESAQQEKSIIFHDNTYIQNSGIDFVNEKTFDVLAVLDGTVINVKDDETLGKIVEIKHDNDYISIYQSLSETTVSKGDKITQGQIIGKSGTNELDKEIGNHLHFELYINGQVVDPMQYLNKEINQKNN